MQIYKPGRPKEHRPLDGYLGCIPKAKGEYRILSKDREVMYVGVSNNINRRVKEHIKSGKINSDNPIVAFKKADGRAGQSRLNDHERKKIKQHSPKLNQRAGGAGRPYKRKTKSA